MKTAVFTVVKNEHKFLDEWIKYHISLGIDEIRVYSDRYSKSHEDICKKYNVFHDTTLNLYADDSRDRRIIHGGFQLQYMRAALDNLKSEDSIDWAAYIDSDEFITLQNEYDTVSDVLSNFNDYNVVVLQWQNYNASGHILSPFGNVIDNYTTPCDLFTGPKMSSIASSKLFFNVRKWDASKVKGNMHIPRAGCKWCKTDFSKNLNKSTYDNIYIRHYITKSFEDYAYRLFDRGQFFNSKCLKHFFLFNPDIDKNDPEVLKIIDSYYDKYMNGELDCYAYLRGT